MSQSLAQKKIAKRYVSSLFADISKDSEIKAVAKNMAEIGAMLLASEDLKQFVQSPLYTKETQKCVIDALAKKAKFCAPVQSLLALLVENRRLNILAVIVSETEKFLVERSGTVPVSIATARKLTAADQKKLQTEIKSAIGKDVVMQTYVDESLIGGLVVQVESTLIDGSIKSKLDKLERKLTGTYAA